MFLAVNCSISLVAVQEVLVYGNEGIIVAQIYQKDVYADHKEYFQQLMRQINHPRPLYKQVGKIILRDTEFPKNTSKKIIRYRR